MNNNIKRSTPFLIAEIGINHNGSLDSAVAIADAAIKSGAEITKHQTRITDDEMANNAKRIIPGNAKKSIYELLLKNCKNEQFFESILYKVKNENNLALKREVLSFSKLWSEQGISNKDLLIALGIER